MEIDDKSGWATAAKSGPVRVSYFVNEAQRTSVDLEAVPAGRISFRPESAADVTVSRQFERPQMVSFIVRSENGNESSNFHGQMRTIHPATATDKLPVLESSLFSCSAEFSGPKQ